MITVRAREHMKPDIDAIKDTVGRIFLFDFLSRRLLRRCFFTEKLASAKTKMRLARRRSGITRVVVVVVVVVWSAHGTGSIFISYHTVSLGGAALHFLVSVSRSYYWFFVRLSGRFRSFVPFVRRSFTCALVAQRRELRAESETTTAALARSSGVVAARRTERVISCFQCARASGAGE